MKNNQYLKCCAIFALLYMVQFLVFPLLFPKYFPNSNNAVLLFVITAFTAILVSCLWISDQWRCLFAANCFYGLLICFFNFDGRYGIGRIGMNLDGMQTRMSFKITVVTSVIVILNFLSIEFLILLIRRNIFKNK